MPRGFGLVAEIGCRAAADLDEPGCQVITVLVHTAPVQTDGGRANPQR